ncbi:ATP-binding protein [Geobacter sp. FeAm09]|uniref:ATP-binding protein n=1 Tax=Geobacter sp. FeAm09 TaxID=2597769 RepID=UPI00143D6A7B|nr:ATP-binding protein [Geobacter sp. FeAm09]
MKYIFGMFILIAGCALALPAVASDLIVSRAALEDAAGTLTITDVVGREFTPIGPTLSRGLTDSAHWLRLRVRAPAKGNEVVLFIRQPFLNEVRLYEADAGAPSGWKTRLTGNHYAFDTRDRARNSLGFVVNVAPSGATYYLRLKTRSSSQLTVEALEPAEAERVDDRFDLMAVFFVTAMLLLLSWALHSYLLDRLPVIGLFALHQAMYTLYGVAITGYLAPFIPAGLPPGTIDWITVVAYCGSNFATILFCRELFKPYQPPPLMMRGLDLLLCAFPLQLAAIVSGHIFFAMVSNLVLVRVTWWYFVATTFTLRSESTPSRRSLRLFFVAVAFIFTLFWIANRSTPASLRGNTSYGRQVLIINGLIIGSIFAMILNTRSRRLQQEAQRSALESQAKSEFLALVSHEIRTPLNALVGFSGMARTATDPALINQYLAILEQSSRSLMELVNDILDMSKIEAGRMEFETVPFDLRQLVAGLEEQYRPLAERKMLAFQVGVADDVPAWVLGDPLRLRQILANLLANAVKFTESGAVSCTVSQAGRPAEGDRPLVRFEVRDTGIGIPENGRALLFQPFRQLDPTISRKFGGTGLGLAIVRNLTELMKGSLTVDSRVGAGSCFTVALPLRETEPAPDGRLAPAAAPAPRAVLVVEDNGFNRRLLGEILRSWGQEVTLAEDGLQALRFMEQRRFDLVLLDIRMPDIDGIEVARRIRRREEERAEIPVPVIAITADADASTRDACHAAGINGVLAKPVVPEQLAQAMAACGGETAAAPPGGEPQLDAQTRNDLAGDPERARQYREMLLQDIDGELRSLQTALERDDRSGLVRAAHTLKGLCGHLANREPAELAAWLQRHAPSARPEHLQPVVEKLMKRMKGGYP